MSIPGESPNPYGQPQPPQPAQPPQQSPQHSAYGQVPQQPPQQPQPNPYAQPTMPAVPMGGYGPMGTPPAAPPMGPAGGGGGGKGWLWGLGGAVVASAVWAGVLFATGGFGDDEVKPDLAGYRYTSNLCTPTDTATFEEEGYEEKDETGSTNPQHSSSENAALDSMTCNIDFEPTGASSSDYSSVWLYTTASLHKKTDPGPEFEALYRAYEDQKTSSYSYKVNKVGGLGDEAYVVTQEGRGSSTGAYVILAVRDGWMTYQSTWSEYVSSSSSATAKTSEEATAMLKKSARSTLEKMRD